MAIKAILYWATSSENHTKETKDHLQYHLPLESQQTQ